MFYCVFYTILVWEFVYREVTSIEASMQSFGRAVVSGRLMSRWCPL